MKRIGIESCLGKCAAKHAARRGHGRQLSGMWDDLMTAMQNADPAGPGYDPAQVSAEIDALAATPLHVACGYIVLDWLPCFHHTHFNFICNRVLTRHHDKRKT